MLRPCLERSLVSAILVSSLAAQSTLFPPGTPVTLPSGLTPTGVGRTAVGDFTGDQQADIALLAGSDLLLAYGVAVHDAVFSTGIQANDFAALSSGDLIIVDSAGVQRLSDYSSGSFDTVSMLNGTEWAGASRVRVGDLDGMGEEDLVGLSALGDILVLERIEEGTPVVRVIPMIATVLDFVPLHWASLGSGIPARNAIAVLRTDGLWVYAANGDVVFAYPVPVTSGLLSVLGKPGSSFERCAVLLVSGGMELLSVFDRTTIDPGLIITGADMFAAASGDADCDGYDDLFLVSRSAHDVWFFRNQSESGSQTFSLSSQAGEILNVGPAGTPPPSWNAAPMLGDVDNDGDVDLCTFVEATGSLNVWANTTLDASAARPTVDGGVYALHTFATATNGTSTVSLYNGVLTLDFSSSPLLGFTPTDLRVTTWRYQNGALEANPFDDSTFPMSGGVAQASIALGQVELETLGVFYYIDARPMQVDGEGNVVAVGPSYLSAFAPEGDDPEKTVQNGSEVTIQLIIYDGNGQPQYPSRTAEPKSVESEKIPTADAPPGG